MSGPTQRRHVLPEAQVHTAIRGKIAARHSDIVDEVRDAVANNAVVVVGMAMNPNPLKARRLLNERGIAHVYLTYGSYLTQWRRRNALKMWTGWPTFPMIFAQGAFIGGASDLAALDASGELAALLAAPRCDVSDAGVQ